MKETTNKLSKILSKSSSNWKENAEYRNNNKWLRYSSQIARRILALIENDEELNQAKLAEAIHVSPQQISKIVQGRENLTLETIYKLSQALRVELISFPPYKYSISPPQLISNSESNETMLLFNTELQHLTWLTSVKQMKTPVPLNSIKETSFSQMILSERNSLSIES